MRWKRVLVAAGLIGAVATAPPLWADEQTKPSDAPPPSEAPKEPLEEPKQKPSFWGDRNALYLEVAGGAASSEQVESSISTLASTVTHTTLELDDVAQGVVAVGWKLPDDRGSFLLNFTGLTESGYTLQSQGLRRLVVVPSTGNQVTSPDFYSWWTVDVVDGRLISTRTPALWQDEVPLNSAIDPGEVTQDPDLIIQTNVPDNVQNRLQTWDGLYVRGFGGRVWSGRWSTGLRYLVYEGNIPATAWLSVAPSFPGDHFTDGAGLRLLSFSQKTTGWGPTGSLAVECHLFRRRLTLYGESRFAFLLEDLETDSGDFYTLVRLSSGGVDLLAIAPARLENSVSKSTWNFGGEIGARLRIVDGFGINVAFNRTAYQDTVLLPFAITIPATGAEVSQGTVGLFHTKDLRYDSVRLGLTFQF